MLERAFNGIIDFLRSEYGDVTQAAVAKKLRLRQPQVSRYQRVGPVRQSTWKRLAERLYTMGRQRGATETAELFMRALADTFGPMGQQELADALHVSQPAMSNWLRGATIPTQANLKKILGLHVARLAKPLVEFHPIRPQRSGNSWRVHDDPATEDALRERLTERMGIYVFYDSTGRVTYLGKTETDLWREAKQRLKGAVNRAFYRPKRQKGIQQGHVARYLSAYEVRVREAIHNLEVLMLRAFPNDLANTNIGRFKKGL